MMPMRMNPACNKNHSKRGLCAEGDETVESIDKGVWHKMESGTRRAKSLQINPFCASQMEPCGYL